MTAQEVDLHRKELELLASACGKFQRLVNKLRFGHFPTDEQAASELTAQMHVVEARIRGLA